MFAIVIKGDFIFDEGEEGSYEKVTIKQKELISKGYELKSEQFDYLNQYYVYGKEDDIKIITFCRL